MLTSAVCRHLVKLDTCCGHIDFWPLPAADSAVAYYCAAIYYIKDIIIHRCRCVIHTVKPVLKDHCHERPPALKDQISLAEGPTFQCD